MCDVYMVYKTTNLINDKIYIGIHKQKGYEFDGYFGSGLALNRAINKYGVENFKRETLFIYETFEECRLKEKEIVNLEFCKSNDTYNISIGGQGGDTLAGANASIKKDKLKRMSYSIKKAKEQMSDEQRAKYSTQMKKIRIQPNNRGRKHTKESLENMAMANHMINKMWCTNGKDNILLYKDNMIPEGYYRGKYIPDEQKFKGHSTEVLKNMSDKRKGGSYYNNGLINIYIHNNESIPNGFDKGLKPRNKTKKYNWYTNGIDNLGFYEGDSIPDGFIKGRTLKKINGKQNGRYYYDGEKSVICKGSNDVVPEGYKLCKRIFYTNGVKNLLLPEDYKYIPDGFVIGKTIKKRGIDDE